MPVQAKLLEIHRKTQAVRQKRRGEQLVLALNRSDYMLDEPSNTLLQVSRDIVPCASVPQILYPSLFLGPGDMQSASTVHASLHS